MVFFSSLRLLLALLASGVCAQTFDWTAIEPSEKLGWVECFDTFQCARLQVPIDYSNETGGKAAIALVKYASAAPPEDYQGAVLFNPGGPAASGVELLQFLGPYMAAIIGPQYDIISFDVRGLGASTPRVEFFATEAERALWLANPYANLASFVPAMTLNLTNDPLAIGRMWAHAQILGEMAKDRDTSGLLEHVGTENIARDMLRITEANGQDSLLYWGLSYGSTLGTTFASMFPDRVGRMLLDGIMDVEGYYATDWRNEVTDSDLTLQAFFDSCYSAGPNGCAFYAPSPSEIEANLNDLYTAVLASPVPFYTSSSYGIVDYRILKNVVYTALWTPYTSFPVLSKGLAELAGGNGATIYQMQLSGAVGFEMEPSGQRFECDCPTSTSPSYMNTWEMRLAISCGDGAQVTDSVADLESYWKEASSISSFSDTMTWMRAICSGWKVHRKDRFSGPIAGDTSFPILFIGNTADPITPLPCAKKTSAAFPGSVVITQNAPGHTSLFTAPSTCLQSYIRAYFEHGTLPEEGTICEVDVKLFPSPLDNGTFVEAHTVDVDAELFPAAP
ncbi:alpha/beta-hydrolase [Hymenopellis radicata]|nr:alpha/beta-hydrolase [Hymenopellis radicata]